MIIISECRCGCGGVKKRRRADKRDRGFLPGHNRKLARRPQAGCHPDRPHYAHGLCWGCYKFKHGLRYQFGMTVEQFHVLRSRQNYKCAICGRANSQITWGRKPKELVIDHDAKTGLIRGLLCDFCNCGLGNFYDNPYLLVRAVYYLAENAGMTPTIPPKTARQRERRRWPQLVTSA